MYLGRKVGRVRTIRYTDPISNQAAVKALWSGLIGQTLLGEFDIIYDYRRSLLYYKER